MRSVRWNRPDPADHLHHLKILRTAGLLDSERRGSWVYYRVVADALQQLSLLLDTDTVLTSSP